MATKGFTINKATPNDEVIALTWAGMANGDVGAAATYPDRDMTLQVTGTLGTGGACALKGSLDGGTTWAALNDKQGNAISLTALGIKSAQDRALLVRPEITAGDGTTALNVTVMFSRPKAPR